MKRMTSYFVAGLVAMLPTVATIYVLGLVFRILNRFGGMLERYIGKHIPGLGVLATVLLILILGFIATNVFGKRLVAYYDNVLQRVPVVKFIYATVKQLVDIVANPGKNAFKRMVMVEWPSEGKWTVGYLVAEKSLEGLTSIFIPTSPNPATGFVVLTTPDRYKVLDMSIEDGMKFIVSCGLITGDNGDPQQQG